MLYWRQDGGEVGGGSLSTWTLLLLNSTHRQNQPETRIIHIWISTRAENASGQVKQSGKFGLISEDKQKWEGATRGDPLESNIPIRECPASGDQHYLRSMVESTQEEQGITGKKLQESGC